ncbi:MAG: hypothetical protein J6J17_01120 [Bacilli bacterium]|nr:hypothetical protein [Bacilli bacterium]
MDLIKATKFFSDIENKGYNIGLTGEDFYLLVNLKNSLDEELVAEDESWYHLYEQIDNLISKIYRSGIIHKYSEETCDYFLQNCSLLPLVLANNKHDKIKLYGDNNYMFLCQFHYENTPSMRVTDLKNLLYCFGCGLGFNTISYIEEYENLGFKETMQLLAQIFLIDIKSYNKKLEPLVLKYQQSILSQKYLELLQVGYQRLKQRYGSTYITRDIDSIYDEKYKTIERIKKLQYDSNFKYKNPKKIMYLNR